MGWGDIWSKAKDIAGSIEHKAVGSGEALGKTIAAPAIAGGFALSAAPGLVWDITKLLTPFDQDDGPDWLSAKGGLSNALGTLKSGGSGLADTLIGNGTLTGWTVNAAGEGLNYAYKNAVENPLETGLYAADMAANGDSVSWGDAYALAKQRTLGQTTQLLANQAQGGLESTLGLNPGSINHLLTKAGPLGSTFQLAGVGAADTQNIDPTDPDAWTKFQKHSPFFSGLSATTVDLGTQFVLDPGIAAGKAIKPLKAANNLRLEGKGLDDLLGTVKTEKAVDAETGEETVTSAVEKLGRIDKMSASQMYYGLGLNKAPEQGAVIASLLAKTNDVTEPAQRLNLRRYIVAAARGDVGAIGRLRNVGEGATADTLSNAILGRQVGSIAAAERDADAGADAVSAFNSPDVIAEVARQLDVDPTYVQNLDHALEYNPLRTSSKGERAVARLQGQGLGRDGTLVTGNRTVDRLGNKILSRIAGKRATGALEDDGSLVNRALADSDAFERDATSLTGTPIDSDISYVHRGPFETPVTINRYGLKAAALNTFKSVYLKPGYVVSDALRGKVVHGALNIEQGQEPLVIEFVRDRMRRAGVDAETANKHLSNVIAATNPTDRFQSVLEAEHASVSAIGKKHGLSDSAIRDLMVAKTRNGNEQATALDGQVRYTAHTKIALDAETGDFKPTRGDVITMTDDAGAIHISTLEDGAKPWPILSTQTPNKVLLPDIDFVRRILDRDAGIYGAVTKMRDNAFNNSPLIDEARELGMRSSSPLRAQQQAQSMVKELAESTNTNWKRATLILRPVSYMLRNTIEEEMRVWATNNLALTTHHATSQMAQRVSQGLKATRLGGKVLNPELHAARAIVATERDELLGFHRDPDVVSAHRGVVRALEKARRTQAKALADGEYAAADDAAADVAAYEARPELAQHEAGKQMLAELDTRLADYDKALASKDGVATGEREFRGITLPNGYEGTTGQIHRQLTATGSIVDDETSAAASRQMSHLRGVGENPVLAIPPIDPPKGYVRRHLTTWNHVLTKQIAQAPEARAGLEAYALGANHDEAVEEVQRFLASPEGSQIRSANRMRARDTEAWANDVVDMIDHHMPSTGMADDLLRGHVDQEYLAARIPDPTLRPAVHNAGVDATFGTQAKKLDVMAGYAFDKMDKVSLQTFIRHPYFNAIFQQEQERLVGHYLDDLIEREGSDPLVDPADINRISERARRTAERRIKTTFYDTSSRSYAAHKLRFVYPFFAAHQDSMQFWGKAIANNPQKLRQLQLAFEAPASAGLAVDHEGNQIKPGDVLGKSLAGGDVYYLMQMPQAWGGPDASNPKDNQARIKIRASSLNLILQNGSVINPGAGPLATIPAAYLQKKWGAKDEDISKALTIFNPYGAPLGDSLTSTTLGLAAPTPVQRAIELYNAHKGNHTHAYNQMFKMYMDEAQVKFAKENDAPPNAQQAKKMEADVAEKVKHASLIRFFASGISPAQPTFQSRLSGMASEYRRLEDQGRQTNQGPYWASDKFLDTYGDAYIALTKSASEYRANVDPTTATYRELDANKKLLRTLDPKTWQVVLAGVKDGPFSTDAYRAMQSFNVDNASNDKLIDEKSPKARDLSIAVSYGWREYSKMMDNLQAAATAYGYPSIDSSKELKAMRQGAVTELSKKFPDWFAEYNSPVKDYDANVIPSLQAIATNKALANDPGRPEIGLVGNYLAARRAVQGILAQRKAAGGYGTIDAKANADVAALFASYVAQLAESNTQFSSAIMPGLIEKDPLYKEELAVSSGG